MSATKYNSKTFSIWWLPLRKITIQTKMTKEQAQARLRKKVRPLPGMVQYMFQWPDSSMKGYLGEISDDHFRIVPIIHYSNPFLPRLLGRYIEMPGGVVIEVRFCINSILLLLYMAFWGILLFQFSSQFSGVPSPTLLFVDIIVFTSLVLLHIYLIVFDARKLISFILGIFRH